MASLDQLHHHSTFVMFICCVRNVEDCPFLTGSSISEWKHSSDVYKMSTNNKNQPEVHQKENVVNPGNNKFTTNLLILSESLFFFLFFSEQKNTFFPVCNGFICNMRTLITNLTVSGFVLLLPLSVRPETADLIWFTFTTADSYLKIWAALFKLKKNKHKQLKCSAVLSNNKLIKQHICSLEPQLLPLCPDFRGTPLSAGSAVYRPRCGRFGVDERIRCQCSAASCQRRESLRWTDTCKSYFNIYNRTLNVVKNGEKHR